VSYPIRRANPFNAGIKSLRETLPEEMGAWRPQIAALHVTRHNTPIHNILSTAPQLSISQKAVGKLPEDGNVMPKHVGAIINKLNK
jgi:hypothetical protein